MQPAKGMSGSTEAAEWAQVGQDVDRLTRGAGRLEAAPPSKGPLLAFRRIVVAVDGSPATEHALAWTRELAQVFHAHVDILNVAPPRVLFDHYSEWSTAPIAPLEAFQKAEQQSQELVQKCEAKLLRSGVGAEGVTLVGFPADEIPRFVVQRKADLLVVGSNRRGALNRLILGRIADAVKNEVPCAVLIAKAPPSKSRLLAAVDGSQSSKRAAMMAIRLAHAWKAHACILHVLEPPVFDLSDEALRSLRSVSLATPPTERDEHVDYEVEFGPAAERIARYAQRKKVGLVVLGSRGLSGLRTLFLGSVSNRVAHAAPTSVLVLKEPPA